MSYHTWHNYGYGICTTDINEQNVDRLQELLKAAPVFRAEIEDWLIETKTETPTWDDYMEYDSDCYLGLATILKEVIEEAEGIELTACDDSGGSEYLLYQAKYPWETPEKERKLTKEQLDEIFRRYVNVLTDEIIDIDDYSPENGG